MLENIFERIDKHEPLTKEEAIELLSIPNLSRDYYRILDKANQISKETYGNRGYIFAQIGLDARPCSGDCAFCSLACSNYTELEQFEKSTEEILELVDNIDFDRVTAIFLMTTAEYDPERFLEVGRTVRAHIPADIAMVANTGDFDLEYAKRLREAGYTGAYHIVRLGEGVDTKLTPECRIQTLDAIEAAGLRLYYCLEPIGPEHTYEELATEMLRARQYHVDVMAAMRRVSVAGTPYEERGMINDFEYAKIVAVARLVTMPGVSMNVHEPHTLSMLGGVNQLYAEIGVNPRDNDRQTERSRGYSVDTVTQLLKDAGYVPCIEGR